MAVTIDGLKKSFNTLTVTIDEHDNREINTTIDNNLGEIIKFYAPVGRTGSEAIIDFRYFDGINYYFYRYFIPFNTIVKEHSDSHIKGSFLGQILYGTETISLTNGSFTITY